MKKWIWVAIGSAVLVIGAVTFSIVLVNTRDVKGSSFNIEGTWRFFEQGKTDQREEYYVFKNGKASNYFEGKLLSESAYEFSSSNSAFTEAQISFVDRHKSYVFSRRPETNNVFTLYPDQTTSYTFVRTKEDEHLNPSTFTEEQFQNKTYDVVLHANSVKKEKEYIVFDQTSFTFYRDDEVFLADHAEFHVNNNVFTSPGFSFRVCHFDTKYVRLVQVIIEPTTTQVLYYPWEWTIR